MLLDGDEIFGTVFPKRTDKIDSGLFKIPNATSNNIYCILTMINILINDYGNVIYICIHNRKKKVFLPLIVFISTSNASL